MNKWVIILELAAVGGPNAIRSYVHLEKISKQIAGNAGVRPAVVRDVMARYDLTIASMARSMAVISLNNGSSNQ